MKTLNSSDFQSDGNKAEIRRKIIEDLKLSIPDVEKYYFTPDYLVCLTKVNEFVEAYPEESIKIFNLTSNGIGPGEILLYFLCDGLTLSGFSSSIDAFLGDKPFAEIKSVIHSKDETYCDFKFGSECSEINFEFLKTLRTFVNHSENPAILENELEIPKTKINELRDVKSCNDEYSLNIKIIKDEIFVNENKLCKRSDIDFSQKIQIAFDKYAEKVPNTFQEIEDQYFSKVMKVLENHKFLFFNRKTAKIIFIGNILKEMLSIERVTQGKIKPFINFCNI